jgi:chemotaxis protein CheX
MNAPHLSLHSGEDHGKWLPTLQLAVQEVFRLMLGCELTVPGEPPPEPVLDLTGMVGLAGKLCGILTLRCTAKSGARMASRMLGVDGEQAGQQMWDAVGEVCNMIAGNFKNKISGLGDGCMLSVPTVITGADYNLHPLVNEQVAVTLMFEGEPIVLSLEVHS